MLAAGTLDAFVRPFAAVDEEADVVEKLDATDVSPPDCRRSPLLEGGMPFLTLRGLPRAVELGYDVQGDRGNEEQAEQEEKGRVEARKKMLGQQSARGREEVGDEKR